jgi:glycosyltransferase involved in cell wall biosynthesis
VRILHVIEGLHPDRGGPPQVAAALARCQRAAGHEVWFASHDARSPEVASFLESSRLAEARRFEVARCGPLGDSAFAAAMPEPPRPDGLHLHGVWNGILQQAARWARRHRIPYVVSTHGSLHPFPMVRGRWKKRIALATTHRTLLRGARRIFTLNDEERNATVALVGPMAETLPNGVDIVGGRPDPAVEGRPYLVYLGRLDWTKGVESLVAAHRMVLDAGIDCDLVVVGNDWGSLASIQAAVATAGSGDRVRLVGPKYGDEKRRLLAGARLLVHLPSYEGFGMAVLESLAAGTPAVIGDRCLLPGAGPSMGVVVSGSRPEEFAATVVAVMRDPGRRDALAAAGLRAVAERFRWETFASRSVAALAGADQ